MHQGWMKVSTAADYADVDPKTLRKWFKGGLRFSRLPTGTILTRAEWIDEYLEAFSQNDSGQLDRLVDDLTGGL